MFLYNCGPEFCINLRFFKFLQFIGVILLSFGIDFNYSCCLFVLLLCLLFILIKGDISFVTFITKWKSPLWHVMIKRNYFYGDKCKRIATEICPMVTLLALNCSIKHCYYSMKYCRNWWQLYIKVYKLAFVKVFAQISFETFKYQSL